MINSIWSCAYANIVYINIQLQIIIIIVCLCINVKKTVRRRNTYAAYYYDDTILVARTDVAAYYNIIYKCTMRSTGRAQRVVNVLYKIIYGVGVVGRDRPSVNALGRRSNDALYYPYYI